MKKPSAKMLSILKSKLNRYGDIGNYYFGGPLTYYEIKVLLYHLKVKVNSITYAQAKRYINEYQKKGINGSSWFYFELKNNEKVVKELGL